MIGDPMISPITDGEADGTSEVTPDKPPLLSESPYYPGVTVMLHSVRTDTTGVLDFCGSRVTAGGPFIPAVSTDGHLGGAP